MLQTRFKHTPKVIYHWPFQGGVFVVVYSNCNWSSVICLLFRIAWCSSAAKELSSWPPALSGYFLLDAVLSVGIPLPFGMLGKIWNLVFRQKLPTSSDLPWYSLPSVPIRVFLTSIVIIPVNLSLKRLQPPFARFNNIVFVFAANKSQPTNHTWSLSAQTVHFSIMKNKLLLQNLWKCILHCKLRTRHGGYFALSLERRQNC